MGKHTPGNEERAGWYGEKGRKESRKKKRGKSAGEMGKEGWIREEAFGKGRKKGWETPCFHSAPRKAGGRGTTSGWKPPNTRWRVFHAMETCFAGFSTQWKLVSGHYHPIGCKSGGAGREKSSKFGGGGELGGARVFSRRGKISRIRPVAVPWNARRSDRNPANTGFSHPIQPRMAAVLSHRP